MITEFTWYSCWPLQSSPLVTKHWAQRWCCCWKHVLTSSFWSSASVACDYLWIMLMSLLDGNLPTEWSVALLWWRNQSAVFHSLVVLAALFFFWARLCRKSLQKCWFIGCSCGKRNLWLTILCTLKKNIRVNLALEQAHLHTLFRYGDEGYLNWEDLL